MNLPQKVLLDTDVIISYLTQNHLFKHSQKIIDQILTGRIKAYISSEFYDDIITMLRSNQIPLQTVINFIKDIGQIPLIPLPTTQKIAETALKTYEKHKGPRKLHYFDSYHIATAKHHKLPLITSDTYILKNQNKLKIKTINLKQI
ncbi:MAG: PIN domain-containing protein [archaeon GB-1867-035]|nr:PIN domain-containing protein [Candidatus Culexmicrobium profundum]